MSNNSNPYFWYQNKLRKEPPDQPVPSSQGARPEAPPLQSAQQQREVKKHPSARKIEANRENSHKSTGPKTSRGKKIVAENATKHGFFAPVVVLRDEDSGETQQEYDELQAALRKEFPASREVRRITRGRHHGVLMAEATHSAL